MKHVWFPYDEFGNPHPNNPKIGKNKYKYKREHHKIIDTRIINPKKDGHFNNNGIYLCIFLLLVFVYF